MPLELSRLFETSRQLAGSDLPCEHIQYSPEQGFIDTCNSSLAEPTSDSYVNCWHYLSDSGEARFIQTEIRPGFNVWVVRGLFQRQVFCSQVNHPQALFCGLTLSGHETSRLSIIDEDVVIQNGHHGIFYTPSCASVGQAQTGIPYLQVGVTLEPEQLRYFFKNERLLLPPFLQPILDRRPDEKVFQMGVATLEMLKTARELLNCRQHGLARKLFLESKALELLSYQMEYFATDDVGRQRPKDIHPEDRRKTEYAHDLLISNIANPPHLKELTKAAGMSHPKLNRCFKQLYGSTVFEYLRNQRLLRASEMLEQPGVTATEVAYTMGYSSPSHFSRAYKKQFGRLPKINPE